MFIALFFFIVNIATLSNLTESSIPGFDFKAFQLPTAILLGVTGVSRAPAVVLDVQNGYFDRLLLSPVRRSSILLGHMVADVAVAVGLIIPILAVGFLVGVRFDTGALGVAGVHRPRRAVEPGVHRLRLRHRPEDRQPGRRELVVPAVLPVPVPHVVVRPREQLDGWLDVVAAWNPVTYLLEGMRSLIYVGWDWSDLGAAVLAVIDRRHRQHVAVLRRPARPHQARRHVKLRAARAHCGPGLSDPQSRG